MYFTRYMNHQLVGVNRLQMQMTSLEDCIAKDNPVRLIEAFVEKLSLKELSIVIACKNDTLKGGRPSYKPQMFLKLYLYGYLNKIRSSRKLEQECIRNVELHWLLQYLTPNYHTIADFRKDNAKALSSLFRLYVSFMDELKLLGKETIAIKREAGDTNYRFKKYTTVACAGCKLQTQCTKLKYRAIERSEYQQSVDANNSRIKENKEYYRKRQAICEHPFGTIKRGWGFTFTLLKGLKKVNGEMNLIMLCYNIKRTISIVGFDRLLKGINNWVPDYKRVRGGFSNLIDKLIVRLNKGMIVSFVVNSTFLQVPVLNS